MLLRYSKRANLYAERAKLVLTDEAAGFFRTRAERASKFSRMPIKLKPYQAPWDGQVVLACRKCQKKLKREDRLAELASLKKAVKARNKKYGGKKPHIVNVSCMDLCPKDGVTVCMPSRSSGQLFILRDEDDLAELFDTPSNI
jgi:hypothetical protein